MTRQDFLKQIGSVEQIGGVRDFTFNDGKVKGVRAIEINTGKVCITVLPDRCMDIAQAFYKGQAVSWISKTGITAPAYYEKDGKSWLRGFFGGLVTTCGLRNIGGPVEEHGLHGRIANTPATKVSVYADWESDKYIMRVSGEMRESSVFGENLVLKRTITAELLSESFTLEDTVVNEGFTEAKTVLCYHCNYGYPLVCADAKLVGVPAEIASLTEPMHGIGEECIKVEHEGARATAGIENGEIGAYITYDRDTLPEFLVWKMLGESEYVVGLEPRTTASGGPNIVKHDKYVKLEPFGEYKTHLEFSFKTL